MTRRRPRRRLARRLVAANGLVIVAGAVTLAVVALLIGPALFHRHVGRALGPVDETVSGHLDQALASSLLVSLGIGTAAAVVAALTVSWVLSTRLARPIEELSDAAGDLASGDLAARAAAPAADDELAELTDAFNEMAEALEHTERTRRQLLADLAHELRTPLSTLEGYLEGLVDGVVPPDERTWETLREATGRLQRLVRDLAVVSLADEGGLELVPQEVDVAVLVAEAAAAASPTFEQAGITLESDVEEGLPAVRVDRDRAHQVLGNLLDNARRHTPRGGHVTLRASSTDHATVVIAVQDDGSGIHAEQLAHVFDRFYRGDGSRRADAGSGIGLTIARAIARAHGGDLTAHSLGQGLGSRFEWHVHPQGRPARDVP